MQVVGSISTELLTGRLNLKCIISSLLFRFEEDLDDYSVIMVKALADRLAEVSTVWDFPLML